MASRRRQILEAVKTRLETILTAGGFATNAGTLVFLNEVPRLGPNDGDVAIAILADPDQASYQGEHVMVSLPLQLVAIAKADAADPTSSWLSAEDVLGDIKTAIEQTDRTLGGLVKRQIQRGVTQTLERDAGSDFVGISITYLAPYTERWGYPDL